MDRRKKYQRLWAGAKNTNGYGRVHRNVNGREIRIAAHRISYELSTGEILAGMHVLHRCDNRQCVNPTHLFLGTQQDNMRDKLVKGRQLKGERVASARLTEENVHAIRRAYACREASQAGLAKQYSVSKRAIQLVLNGQNWKHVAIADSLRQMLASYPNGETYVNVRVQGTVER